MQFALSWQSTWLDDLFLDLVQAPIKPKVYRNREVENGTY